MNPTSSKTKKFNRARLFTAITSSVLGYVLDAQTALGQSNSEKNESTWSETGSPSEEVEGNPSAPITDPKLKRSRAVPLPGKGSLREEKTGLFESKGKKSGTNSPEFNSPGVNGFGLVEKPKKTSFSTTQFPTRLIFLNGKNISSLKDEVLENVTVKIDFQGNLQITAPHYEVSEQSSYHPLLPSELPRYPKRNTQPALEDFSPAGSKYSKDEGWIAPTLRQEEGIKETSKTKEKSGMVDIVKPNSKLIIDEPPFASKVEDTNPSPQKAARTLVP